MHKTLELVIEALSQDARETQPTPFEADGFAQFFPEENPQDVTDAWTDYCGIHNGSITVEYLIKHYAEQS